MSSTILAIEASSETCSVALLCDDNVYQRLNDTPRGHANNILPMINSVLDDAHIKSRDIDVIAVTNGPGAFTSVRIGVAVCQGLAAALNCPVISISSLAVLAYEAMQTSQTTAALVALDARMDEVYFGAYCISSTGLPEAIQADVVSKPCDLVLPPLTGAELVSATGMGWQVYTDDMSTTFSAYNLRKLSILFPSATYLLEIAEKMYQLQQFHNVRDLVPVYLRDNVVNG